MSWSKFIVAAIVVLALLVPGMAASYAKEVRVTGACLKLHQRRAVIARHRVVKLSTAIRRVHKYVHGDVIRAQLCPSAKGYVYLLTVLTRSGKVVRASVDAATGRLIGVR
jgi:uncharacterized membrane protein YkoI